MLPEHPPRRTHLDSGNRGSGDSSGSTVLVVAAAPIGITTYDTNGDHSRRRYPRGAAMADVMMTMAGEKEGEAKVRRS